SPTNPLLATRQPPSGSASSVPSGPSGSATDQRTDTSPTLRSYRTKNVHCGGLLGRRHLPRQARRKRAGQAGEEQGTARLEGPLGSWRDVRTARHRVRLPEVLPQGLALRRREVEDAREDLQCRPELSQVVGGSADALSGGVHRLVCPGDVDERDPFGCRVV